MKRSLALWFSLVLLVYLTLPIFAAEAPTFTVRSVEDLTRLSEQCVLDAWSEGKTVTLEADLDLTGAEFLPIAQFAGVFRGNGHTISGLNLTGEGGTIGLFRKILPSGVVENLRVAGTVTLSGTSSAVGGVCGENRGVLRNCGFAGTVRAYRAVGGVCGSNAAEGVVENCTASGTVCGQHRVGGIVGEAGGLVRGCSNQAEINADVEEEIIPEAFDLHLSTEELIDVTDVGGIAGRCEGVLQSCENSGSVGHPFVGYNVGGIAGQLSGSVSGCKNHAAVRGRKDVGGVVGQIDPSRRWSVSAEKLDALQERLDELNRSVNRLADDAAGLGATLSGEFAALTGSLSGALGTAQTLSGAAKEYLNDNIASVNALGGRIREALTELNPVLSQLTDVTEPLPEVFSQLRSAIVSLYEAGAISGEVYKSLLDAWEQAQSALLSAKQSAQAAQSEVSAFLSDPKPDKAGALAEQIAAELQSIRGDLSTASSALLALNGILSGLTDAGEPLQQALSHGNAAADAIVRALSALDTAAELFSAVSAQAAGYRDLTISAIEPDTDGVKTLFSALKRAVEEFRTLTSHLGDPTLAEDVKAVSDGFYELGDCLLELAGQPASARELVQVNDVSAVETAQSTASVADCLCDGSAEAQTNAGGIVGAISIELAFDLEDEYDLSALVAGGAKYLVYASVRGCHSSADVYAKKSAAGGIVGRMDYGALSACRASGSIRTDADYAGGIAGYSGGDIAACLARTELSGVRYVGGIAGFGRDLSDCDCLPGIPGSGAYFGSVAGDVDGTVTGCRYADCPLGAVNGFSYTGQAEQVSLEELLRTEAGAELFQSVTVRFSVEGVPLTELTLPYGGRVGELPAVPERDGKRWRWDDFDRETVRKDLRIDGSYVCPVYTLSDGQTPAGVLAEGLFDENQRLTVTPFNAADLLVAKGRTVLGAATLFVDGYAEPLTVRLRAQAGSALYTAGAGEFREQSYETDGSYLVFPLENGGSYLLLTRKPAILFWLTAGGLVLCVLAVLTVIGLCRRGKRKKTAAGQTQDSSSPS